MVLGVVWPGVDIGLYNKLTYCLMEGAKDPSS